jgi:hypothetical protein
MSTKSVGELRKELRGALGRISKMPKEEVLRHLGHVSAPAPASVPIVVAVAEKKKLDPVASPAPAMKKEVSKEPEKKKVKVEMKEVKVEKKKLVKGSEEMKAHMAKLREMRLKKKKE